MSSPISNQVVVTVGGSGGAGLTWSSVEKSGGSPILAGRVWWGGEAQQGVCVCMGGGRCEAFGSFGDSDFYQGFINPILERH